MPELIVHIGAGKTGSTSIQFSLRDAEAVLAGQGVAYVGLMLEQVPGALQYDWCARGAPQKFFQAEDKERTDEEVYQAVRAEIDRLGRQGIDRVIWSNEAFLVQNSRIIPILQRLAADGVSVRPVCYVRRHDKRARSAYLEFGLKSKRHTGPVRSFGEWYGTIAIRYGESLDRWREAFPGLLEIYNFDEIRDVAAHFCSVAGLSGVAVRRANEALPLPILAARAVFNSDIDRATWANDFSRVMKSLELNKYPETPMPPIQEMMPSEADLERVRQDCAGDLQQVNELLAEQGQPPLSTAPFEMPAVDLSPWEMDQALLRIVISLQRQVNQLRRRVAALEGGADPGGD